MEGISWDTTLEKVEPVAGYKTLGELAMVGGAVVVTTKEGALKVETGGHAMNVTEGKSVTVNANPAPAPPQGGGISGSTGLQWAAVGAGGTSAVLSGVAISKANDARDAANAANTTAAAAGYRSLSEKENRKSNAGTEFQLTDPGHFKQDKNVSVASLRS